MANDRLKLRLEKLEKKARAKLGDEEVDAILKSVDDEMRVHDAVDIPTYFATLPFSVDGLGGDAAYIPMGGGMLVIEFPTGTKPYVVTIEDDFGRVNNIYDALNYGRRTEAIALVSALAKARFIANGPEEK